MDFHQRKQFATILTAIASILLSAVIAAYYEEKASSSNVLFTLSAVLFTYSFAIIISRGDKNV